MVDRILKSAAIFSVFFVILVCASLTYLPNLSALEQEMIEEQRVEAAAREKLMNMTGLQILDYNTTKADNGDEENDFPEQLRIALPDGATGETVTIDNKYVTQTIDITIPGADENYMYAYPMLGKSDNISNLTYESTLDHGVIEIVMDKVYELETSFEDGYLYLDFIPPHDIYDKVVVIDAGHGGNTPGATKQGVYEKDIDLAIVLQLKQIFEENPDESIGVYYTRTDDSNPSFEDRVGLANKSDADIFISVHNNSTVNGRMSTVNGTCVMYDELKAEEPLGTKGLAEICAEEVTKETGSQNRGIIEGNEIYIIRTAEVPVALIEVGFMTNQEELDKLKTEEYQRKVAQGIYNSIMRAFEEGY